MKRFALAIVLLMFMPLLAELSQSLENADKLKIGDSFRLKIYTELPLREIELPDSLKAFRLKGQSRRQEAGKQLLELEIAVLDLGAQSFPQLAFLPEDGSYEPLYSDGFRLHILPVRAESDSLLRDIKAPGVYQYQLPFWLYLLFALLFVGLGLYLIILVLRRRPKKVKPAPPPPPPAPLPQITAWQEALQALRMLKDSGLLAKSSLEYHFRLSQILREYLKKAYQFNALEMTTFEIRIALKEHREAGFEAVMKMLVYYDRVKFAKWQSEPAETLAATQDLEGYFLNQGEQNGL